MNIASHNPYAFNRNQAILRYRTHLQGALSGLFVACYVASEPYHENSPCELAHPIGISEVVQTALRKSAEALGYGEDAVTFISLSGLDPQEIFQLVESLDPLSLVICNDQARTMLEKAYHVEIQSHHACRVFGRELRAFDDLDLWMSESSKKQRVWSLLKTLPHL